jgi:hypothetical protein
MSSAVELHESFQPAWRLSKGVVCSIYTLLWYMYVKGRRIEGLITVARTTISLPHAVVQQLSAFGTVAFAGRSTCRSM